MFSTCSPMSAPVCQAGSDDDGTRPKKPTQGHPVPCNGTNQLVQAHIKGRTGSLCYAESADGITWEKPGLGLVPFVDNAGKHYPASETNIVLGDAKSSLQPISGRYPTGNGVTLDEREGQARWKMLGVDYIATSEDGRRWGNKTTMPKGRWDSHLNVQYESDSGKWVAYARATPTTQYGSAAAYGNAQTARIQSVSESLTPDFLGEWGTIVPTGMNTSAFCE